MTDRPPPPDNLGDHGRNLWTDVVQTWALDPDELALLAAAAASVDELARIEAALADAELIVAGSAGQPVAHPLLAEARAHRETLRRQLSELRIPAEPGGASMSDWGKTMASKRWKRHGAA